MSLIIAWRAGQFDKLIKLGVAIGCMAVSPLCSQHLIQVTPNFLDHGAVRIGRVIEDTIIVANAGDSKICINKVKTTCGCTASDFRPICLAPGDSARIPYFFDTQGFSGLVRKSITLHFKEKDLSPLHYQFQVRVYQDLEMVPRFIYLPQLHFKTDSLIVQNVELQNHTNTTIQIVHIATDTPELVVNPTEFRLGPQGVKKITVNYKPAVKCLAQWTITIQTDCSGKPKIVVPFYVTFKDN